MANLLQKLKFQDKISICFISYKLSVYMETYNKLYQYVTDTGNIVD